MTVPAVILWCRPQYGGKYCDGKSYEVEYCSPNVRHCGSVFVCMHVCMCVGECTLVCEAGPTVCRDCFLQDCARDTYRNEQCAATNNMPFNGQLHTWTEFDNERG